GLNRIGDRAVVDQGHLVPATVLYVPIESVVASVELAADKPSVVGLPRVVENLVPPLVPVDLVRGLNPKPLGVIDGPPVNLFISAIHDLADLLSHSVCVPRLGRRDRLFQRNARHAFGIDHRRGWKCVLPVRSAGTCLTTRASSEMRNDCETVGSCGTIPHSL